MEKEFRLPELGEQVEAGEVTKILVASGDTVARDQPVLEIEIDKAILEIPSPFNGVVKAVLVNAGEQVSAGQPILTVNVTDGLEAAAVTPREPDQQKEEKPSDDTIIPDVTHQDVIPAAPSARRIARELDINITQVPGSGPSGWISEEDVKLYARKLGILPKVLTETTPLPDFSQWGNCERKPFTPLQRTMAERMREAWSTMPQVTQHDKADITDLENQRKRYAPTVEVAGGKLTLTAMILKVLASTLPHFPHVNSTVDMPRHEMVVKRFYNIGVAIDTPRGLVVPVIRNIDKKTLLDLAVELTTIAEKAREGLLRLEDMQGGTFSLSNLGGIGGTYFSPIVNPPNVAILGVSRAVTEPVFREGKFVPRLMLPLSLSYDHRAIDGATGARFMRQVAETLEQPSLLPL